MELIGQIIGFVAIFFGFFIFVQKERKNVLLFKLITDVVWVIHFAIIGAYTPALTTFCCAIREVVFMEKKKSKFLKGKAVLIIFCVLFLLCAVFTWKGPQSLIPSVASSLSTIAFFNKEVKKIRLFSFFVSILMLINGIVFNSYANILNEIIAISSIIIGTIRAKNIKNKG